MFTYKFEHPLAKHPQRVGGDGAAGYDLYSVQDREVASGEIALIDIGIKVTSFSKGWVGFIKERSGLAMKGIRIAGGVIDPFFRGNIFVAFHNLSKDTYKITAGDRIAQMVFLKIADESFIVAHCDETDTPDAPIRGLGSSGY